MTTHADDRPRPRRAALIGLGFDDRDDPRRVIHGEHCLLVGGSAETHARWVETMLRLETELERLGCRLGDVAPDELAEIAWRIDSPEILSLALRLDDGLRRRGVRFADSSASLLNELMGASDPTGPEADREPAPSDAR